MEREPILTIQNLKVSFTTSSGSFQVLRGISYDLKEGEIHSLVGESGSGKTVTSTCILGLLPSPSGHIDSGTITYRGKDITTLRGEALRLLRGKEIAMVFQEPSRYLNPAFRIGEQITEMLILHQDLKKTEAEEKTRDLLAQVGLGEKKDVFAKYPHELSGGMKQRAMIAMAISCGPSVLIADEPTTALDVTLQLQILHLILKLKKDFGMGVLFISHDLGVVYSISDRVSVIYAGRIVESASRDVLFSSPLHPYTRMLLLSIPDARRRGHRLKVIPGRVPEPRDIPPGCPFHPRCPQAEELCKVTTPETRSYGNGHSAACHFTEKPWNDS
ncbi:MAG: ABC transporter ATP-binding protein [Spirochaetales bacterium]|nr:ABC transporter ATP-binding protein [Spirochaetales bacterium]